jgi:hypothetical protein
MAASGGDEEPSQDGAVIAISERLGFAGAYRYAPQAGTAYP